MEEHMSVIQSYIEELKIKKVFFGGFDQEEVYTSLQALSSMYQKDIMQLKAAKEQLEKEHKTTVNELEQANKDIQLLKFQLEEQQKGQNKYDIRFNALTQAIDAINANKEEVIEESKKTAEGIVAEANERFERITKECLVRMQQKDLIISKITDVKQQFGTSMENLHSILAKMLLEVDFLQKDGLEQAFSGDETDRLVRKMTGSVSENDIQ
jgi:chromosome segregation ATPase